MKCSYQNQENCFLYLPLSWGVVFWKSLSNLHTSFHPHFSIKKLWRPLAGVYTTVRFWESRRSWIFVLHWVEVWALLDLDVSLSIFLSGTIPLATCLVRARVKRIIITFFCERHVLLPFCSSPLSIVYERYAELFSFQENKIFIVLLLYQRRKPFPLDGPSLTSPSLLVSTDCRELGGTL